jgi:hypothetical protein
MSPPILGERAPGVAAAAAASEVAFAAGRADRERARLRCRLQAHILNFFKPVPRLRLRDEQRAKEAAAVAQGRGQRHVASHLAWGCSNVLSMGLQQCVEHGGAAGKGFGWGHDQGLVGACWFKAASRMKVARGGCGMGGRRAWHGLRLLNPTCVCLTQQ